MTAPGPRAVDLPGAGEPAGVRVELDREGAERGLAGLVLAIVELIRQLMERQALRRVAQGDLTGDQIERLGSTLMELDLEVKRLCARLGLSPADLNLDLGPLGHLFPLD